MRTLGILILVATALAQGHHRTENRALLGIVAIPKGDRIIVAHVLKKSPAQKAGLQAGDEIRRIGGSEIRRPADVDRALAGYAGKEKIEVEYRRANKDARAQAKLILRGKYRGDFLKRQTRGKTGFKAPPWFVYAWARAGEEAPTRENTKGKVVVLHCFQSW